MQDPKYRHLGTIAQLCRAMSSQLRAEARINNRKKNLLSSNISRTCHYNIMNFGLLAAEIVSLVCGTPASFNGFRVLAALLHGSPVVAVSQTLRRWREGATYIRQGGHHVGHWPTFYFCIISPHSLADGAHCMVEDVAVKKFTFAISSPDEFLVNWVLNQS